MLNSGYCYFWIFYYRSKGGGRKPDGIGLIREQLLRREGRVTPKSDLSRKLFPDLSDFIGIRVAGAGFHDGMSKEGCKDFCIRIILSDPLNHYWEIQN